MNHSDIETAREGVEQVACLDEREFLRSSPFHLGPCGGCGAPSFGQPCAICSYYPMGRDQGYFQPKDASFAVFANAIERSGPGGKGGNIATWYLASYKKTVAGQNPSFARKVDRAIGAAADLDLPAAQLYWNVASRVGAGQQITRSVEDRFELFPVWSASDELMAQAWSLGERGVIRPIQVEEIKDAVTAWVEAAHDGRNAVISGAVSELLERAVALLQVARNGNVLAVVERLRVEDDKFKAKADAEFDPSVLGRISY